MSFEQWHQRNIETGRSKPAPVPLMSGFQKWQAKNLLSGAAAMPVMEEEGAIRTFGEEFGKGVLRGSLNVVKGLVGTAEFIVPGKQESWLAVKEKIGEAAERFPVTHQGTAAWAGRILGEALPYMGLALVGGYAGAAAKGAAVFGSVLSAKAGVAIGSGLVGFSVMGDQAYDEAITKGATELEAQSERLIVGTINAAIEASQISRIIKFHSAGKHTLQNFIRLARGKTWKAIKAAGGELAGFGAQTLKIAIQETAEEMMQEGVSIAVPWAIRGDVPRTETGEVDVMAIGQRMGEAGLAGGFAGGVLGGAGAVTGGIKYAAAPTETEVQKVAERVRSSSMNKAEKTLMLRELEKFREDKGDLLVSEEQLPIEQVRDQMDAVIEPLELLRPLEEAEIAKESAKRWEEYQNIADGIENPRLKAMYARAALKGQKKFDIPPLESYFTEEQVATSFETLWESTQLDQAQKDTGNDALEKLFVEGKIPAVHELRVLKKIGLLSDKSITKLLATPKSTTQKIWANVKDLSMAPWSILTSIDLSFTRQGWLMAFNKPKLVGKTIGKAYRFFANEDYYKFRELQRKTHPLYQEALKAGIEETSIDGITPKEEMFSSQLVQKIPGIRPSARGYVGSLNEERFGFYFQVRESAEGVGMTPKQQKDLGTLANDFTGRGEVPDILKKVQEVGMPIFALKLNAARIRSVTDLVSLKGPARKMLAGTLVKFVGITLAALYLLDRHKKVKVEWNPKSSDFLKVRYGKSRIDITGGYQQLIRTTAQLITAKRKTTEAGTILPADRKDVIASFIQSKLSPHAGLIVDLWRGKTFRGDKLRLEPGMVAGQFYERITPLFIQDVIEAARFQGVGMASVIAPMAFHGVGVQTYDPSLSDTLKRDKNTVAHQYFGKKWDDLGPDAQEALGEYHPQFAVRQLEIKQKREDWGFVNRIIEESDEAGRRIIKGLPKDVQSEFDLLFVDFGLSRHVGSSWYLNDKRYETYQNDVKKMLKKYLTFLVRDPIYNSMNEEGKREALSELIDEIKAKARMDLKTTANYEDLISL